MKGSSTEEKFNICLIIEKCLNHHEDCFHNLLHFKNVFVFVWHALGRYNVDELLVDVLLGSSTEHDHGK